MFHDALSCGAFGDGCGLLGPQPVFVIIELSKYWPVFVRTIMPANVTILYS
jgi:hypothetical protein